MTATRSNLTSNIHKNYRHVYRISGGLTLVILGIWLGSLIFTEGYATNVYTEMLSVIATILVLDQINQWRDRRTLKERLLNEVKSSAQGQATAALAWLKREAWIQNDSFRHSDLQHVNWTNAYLGEMDFENSNLRGANLQKVTCEISDSNNHIQQNTINLRGCNLQLALLQDANLPQAILTRADLYGAHLENAYLREAVFDFANLRHARLNGTILTSVSLLGANLAYSRLEDNKWILRDGSKPAILPDGTTWTAETDMEKFTHPEHPEFAATLEAINNIRAEMGIAALS